MDSNKKVSLLELDGKYMVGNNNKIMFSLNSQRSFIEYDTANIYKLVDPVYDQVFKSKIYLWPKNLAKIWTTKTYFFFKFDTSF